MAGTSSIVTPRYSYAVRSSTMYHNSTMYERATLFAGGRPVVAGSLGFGHAEAAEGASEMTDEYDEEPWPFYRHPRSSPRPGRAAREEAQEHRIAGHVRRHQGRGTPPPRRDRGLSRAEIGRA